MKMKKPFQLFPWVRYSKKMCERIKHPKNAGFLVAEEAASKGMRLVIGEEGEISDGNKVELYWIVDEEDGIIADAKFQVFGQTALIAAADMACELLLRKNYTQAGRLSADILDKQLRDKPSIQAFPDEVAQHINLVLFAIENAAEKCMDIPVADVYTAPPIDVAADTESVIYPGWELLSQERKLEIFEEVIKNDIRPYIELDAGGIRIIEFKEPELFIAYEGSCTSCHSATGATLTAIQQILRSKLHPSICVIPDASFLNTTP